MLLEVEPEAAPAQGVPSADHSGSDGYAAHSGDYFKAFQDPNNRQHAERNSHGDLVALGEAEAVRS